jgi:hypothetical protein
MIRINIETFLESLEEEEIMDLMVKMIEKVGVSKTLQALNDVENRWDEEMDGNTEENNEAIDSDEWYSKYEKLVKIVKEKSNRCPNCETIIEEDKIFCCDCEFYDGKIRRRAGCETPVKNKNLCTICEYFRWKIKAILDKELDNIMRKRNL